MPALLTSVSARPKRSSACDTMRSAVLGSAMSPATARISGSDDGLIERELATTRKLRSRYPLTRASPIPCDAPVMIATFCSAPMMDLYDLCQDGDHRRLVTSRKLDRSRSGANTRYSADTLPRRERIGSALPLVLPLALRDNCSK